MSIKPDKWIKDMALKKGMIEPFEEKNTGKSEISYGISSYGYDFRLSDEFFTFKKDLKNPANITIDPKNFDNSLFIKKKEKHNCTIAPNSFILARSKEYFRIPRNILTICFGKSTYARCGIIVNVTPFEPEWEGFATLSIINASPYPANVYVNEGIAQLIFLESKEMCLISYADKKGRYQAQKKITLPK